jgi:hypothetical protein
MNAMSTAAIVVNLALFVFIFGYATIIFGHLLAGVGAVASFIIALIIFECIIVS